MYSCLGHNWLSLQNCCEIIFKGSKKPLQSLYFPCFKKQMFGSVSGRVHPFSAVSYSRFALVSFRFWAHTSQSCVCVSFSLCFFPLQICIYICILASLQHMEFPGQGSYPSCTCDLHHSCGNAGSLTHCARPGIDPVSQHSRAAADPVMPQQELQIVCSFICWFLFFFFFFNGCAPWHMKVPGPGTESKPQLQ